VHVNAAGLLAAFFFLAAIDRIGSEDG